MLEYISDIRSTFYALLKTDNKENLSIKNNWFKLFEDTLTERGESFTRGRGAEFFGIGYTISARQGPNNSYPEFSIDPLALNNIWETLKTLNGQAYDNHFDKVVFDVKFKPLYLLPDNHALISSRLLNTEVSFDTPQPHLIYKFRNIQFRFRISIEERRQTNGDIEQKELILLVNQNNEETIPLLSLIKLLIQQNVITKG